MFYCNNCAEKYNMDNYPVKSLGICEICGDFAETNDNPFATVILNRKKSNKRKRVFYKIASILVIALSIYLFYLSYLLEYGI